MDIKVKYKKFIKVLVIITLTKIRTPSMTKAQDEMVPKFKAGKGLIHTVAEGK